MMTSTLNKWLTKVLNVRDIVERIVSHTGNSNYRKKMKFEVKWLGYGPEENTMEPWTSELWNLEVMHEYLAKSK